MSRTARRAITLATLLFALAIGAAPEELHGQGNYDKLRGSAFGAFAGVWWTMSITGARARNADVLFTPQQLLKTAIPVTVATTAGGLALGHWAGDHVAETMGWGAVGWAAGFGLGWIVGDVIWEDDPGKWVGGVVGAGLGLALGAVIGGLNGGGVADEPLAMAERPRPLSLGWTVRW